jgi:PKD repeat protein
MKIRLPVIAIIVLTVTAIAISAKMSADNAYAQNTVKETATTYSNIYEGSLINANSTDIGNRKLISNLAPNEYTPKNYVPPVYDPFNNQNSSANSGTQQYEESYPPFVQPNTLPEATFSVVSKRSYMGAYAATVGNKFVFNAGGSRDNETSSNKLQVRWDFESDGKPDTWFSTIKSESHIYSEPGVYTVTLEVLDGNGGISKIAKEITIVNNTPPTAYLVSKTQSGTLGTIFEFNTGKSSDSQYRDTYLEYRFDWDGDGIFDTAWQYKTAWQHKFENAGNYHVVMEVRDPEGLTATYYRDITVFDNDPPHARFVVNRVEVKKQLSGAASSSAKSSAKTTIIYKFDASFSTDKEAQKKLLYRWDFNYTGPDDIVYDTGFSSAPKYSGSYSTGADISASKTVRLQVKDADGATDEEYMVL